MSTKEVKVWDPFVRIFHWTLVVAFTIAYITEDDFMTVHVYAGYLIAGLVLLRILWGVVGGRYARFSSFVRRPSEVIAYMKDIVAFRPKHYVGHNPAGGAMVIALLLSLGLTVFFGLLTYGAMEFSGPLAGLTAGVGDAVAHGFKEVHEFFANFTLMLVVLHVVGVLVASMQHRENLVRSMITGIKRINKDEDSEVQS
ncbi:cytochrome b/b6 domain-containing protein [Thiolapillus sp.]